MWQVRQVGLLERCHRQGLAGRASSWFAGLGIAGCEGVRMTDPKEILVRYLQGARDSVLWKLEGLGEYDVRRPLTPTGTNLLGLVKHLASLELGYFGDTFGRPSGIDLP